MKTNLLIIIHKLNGGGAERCASNLSIELSKKYNVHIACFDCRNITYPYGGKLIDIDIPDSRNAFKRAFNMIRRILKVRNIKKQYNIDCSISLLDGPNIVNILSKKDERTIVSIRNCLSKEPMPMIRKAFIKLASRIADKTVALSRLVSEDLHKNFCIPEDKIVTIYNHCDAALLKELAQNATESMQHPEGFKYVTMGRLNIQKGQWHLLRAFKYVVAKYPDSKLIILGEGELKTKLEELATNLGIMDSVTFTGYIKAPHSYLSKCDVFVFPSLYEGLGNVLLEAMALGMPIISTDCDAGPREILAPDTDITAKCDSLEFAEYGLLIPAMDIGGFNSEDSLDDAEVQLANAMIEMRHNNELREKYRKKSSEGIKAFEKSAIIKQWDNTIQD